eukprot:1257750-Rhodomonas_salina.1
MMLCVGRRRECPGSGQRAGEGAGPKEAGERGSGEGRTGSWETGGREGREGKGCWEQRERVRERELPGPAMMGTLSRSECVHAQCGGACEGRWNDENGGGEMLSLIHISEPTRPRLI